ncbi:MAG: ABC transporter ATP-binding protein [Alphaproteobacteria bacterium]|nr:ABC transporter ATP-binding protein [Alphaproteobacteria bacterium]
MDRPAASGGDRRARQPAALSLEAVSHRFGTKAVLDHVSLEVAPREIVCLLGPSGCGKTTLLRIAAGLEPLQQGRVAIGGRVVSGDGDELPPEERHVGFVFQDYALFPHLDLTGNVAFGLGFLPGAERRDRALAFLDRVGLADRARSYPHMLSGGEQQRVALARALAPRPGLMLLDEPFSNLDVRLREEVREATLALLREAGAASLIVTHDAEEALYMSDRLVIMRDGRVVQAGSPEAVYGKPDSAFVTRFLGAVTSMHGVVHHGMARVAVGEVGAEGMADGTRVDVLIRPEGVELGDALGAIGAVVIARHLLGAEGVAALRLDGGAELGARWPARLMPAVGTRVKVRLDPKSVFVFPCAPGGRGDP